MIQTKRINMIVPCIALLCCISLLSCKEKEPTIITAERKVDGKKIVIDTLVELQDSAIAFIMNEVHAKQMRDEMEIKYLRTGQDKYRIIGDKYGDSVHYWWKKADKCLNHK